MQDKPSHTNRRRDNYAGNKSSLHLSLTIPRPTLLVRVSDRVVSPLATTSPPPTARWRQDDDSVPHDGKHDTQHLHTHLVRAAWRTLSLLPPAAPPKHCGVENEGCTHLTVSPPSTLHPPPSTPSPGKKKKNIIRQLKHACETTTTPRQQTQ